MAEGSAAKVAPLNALLAIDVASAVLLAYLQPVEVLSLASTSKVATSFVSSARSTAETFWKAALVHDFSYRDKQVNRSAGFYKRMYQSLVEDRVMEDNLVTGGH